MEPWTLKPGVFAPHAVRTSSRSGRISNISQRLKEEFYWVKEARVQKEFPDILRIRLTERKPLVHSKYSDVGTSGLEFEVTSGTNHFDIQVEGPEGGAAGPS